MQYNKTTNQFICVISKKVETGRALNALGHMTAGLVAKYGNLEIMRFQDYKDATNNEEELATGQLRDRPLVEPSKFHLFQNATLKI